MENKRLKMFVSYTIITKNLSSTEPKLVNAFTIIFDYFFNDFNKETNKVYCI